MAEGSPFRNKQFPLNHVRDLIRWHRRRMIAARLRSRFSCGSDVAFGKGADIRVPNYFRLGHHVGFGKNFTCETDLEVGDFVLFSSNVAVVGKDHPFDDPTLTVYTQPRVDNSPVQIGSDVLIGFGTIVVGPVLIGDGCIVGAGSVVTRDLPSYSVCAGTPARVIRKRHSFSVVQL